VMVITTFIHLYNKDLGFTLLNSIMTLPSGMVTFYEEMSQCRSNNGGVFWFREWMHFIWLTVQLQTA
jgi:hypothetical protein